MKTAPMQINNNLVNESPMDQSQVSWVKLNLTKGNYTFDCPGCSEKRSFRVSHFAPQAPPQTKEDLKSQGIFPTDKLIMWGKTSDGIVLAAVAAIVAGIAAADVLGGVSAATGITAAVVFMVFRPVCIRMFMAKMPVWEYRCHNCDALSLIASNGKVVVGESSERSTSD